MNIYLMIHSTNSIIYSYNGIIYIVLIKNVMDLFQNNLVMLANNISLKFTTLKKKIKEILIWKFASKIASIFKLLLLSHIRKKILIAYSILLPLDPPFASPSEVYHLPSKVYSTKTFGINAVISWCTTTEFYYLPVKYILLKPLG